MKEVFSFLTDAKTLYWIVGYVALTVYWVGKTKGDPTVNAFRQINLCGQSPKDALSQDAFCLVFVE